MTYNPLELVEAEEDYTGINPNNLVVDELHNFTDYTQRIFAPDLGQFYVNQNFSIIDTRTGRELVRGDDYKLEYFSKKIFKKTGLSNYYIINVFNSTVAEVRVSYQAVGGLYTSPAYLIALMMEKYPDGIGPVVYWKNILFKPDQFKPASHRHHANEIYGLSGGVDAVEIMRGAFAALDGKKFLDFYNNTTAAYDSIMASMTSNLAVLQTQLQDARKSLEIQQGDFVYTDSTADQTVLRKYGKWKKHSNVILAAGGTGNSGTSMSVGEGYSVPVRRTNLFQRIDDPWGVNPDIEIQTLILEPTKSTFNEGETITINVKGVNIPPGRQITGKLIGIEADNVKDGNLTWAVTLDAQSNASFNITTVNNARTTGDLDITILPEYYSEAAIHVTLVDTSKTPVYRVYFSADAAGVNVIGRANEGTVVYMNTVVTNPIQGEVLSCNYATGTTTQQDFNTALPSTITIPSDGIVRTRIEIKNDEVAEGEEILVINLLPNGSTDLTKSKARAELIVNDTSFQAEFDAYFSSDTSGTARITEVQEGQTCYIFARTTLPNGTKVLFDYAGTTDNDDFDYRPAESIVTNGVLVGRVAVKADKLSEGDEILGVSCRRENGSIIANLSIIVRDTSLSPSGDILFSKSATGNTHVSDFNEGNTIFIVINTKNLENGSIVGLRYEMDGASNQTQIDAEFTAPLPSSVAVTNNKVVIAATILEDYKADGDRNFKAILSLNNVIASCVIRDTSVPTYATKFSSNADGSDNIGEINEGSTAYLVFDTRGVPAGRVFSLRYTGSSTDADFNAARPTTITASANGRTVIPYAVKNDYLSEGVEDMVVTVSEGSITRASSSLVIRDTSLTPNLSVVLGRTSDNQGAITSLGEGITAYVFVNWVNVPLNTSIKWEVVHGSTNNADFDRVSNTFTNTEYTGTRSDTITTIADATTEGDETFKIKATFTLPDGRVITAQTNDITLLDTSKTEVFSVYFSSDSQGNSPITRINEGQSAYLIIKGTNIPNGTAFRFGYGAAGNGYTADDDFNPGFNNVTKQMNNNIISHAFDVLADRKTEGDESLVLRVTRVDSNRSVDASLVVLDTSRQMTGTLILRLSDGNAPPNGSFNEGQSGYAELNYSNATIGDKVTCLLNGGSNVMLSNDFSASQFGQERTVTSESGTLRWTFTIANDRNTDGNKNFLINANNLTTTLNYPLSGNYNVIDTSKTTTYNSSGFANTGGGLISSANEGERVLLQTVPVDGVVGDVYRMSITGGSAGLNSDYTVNTSDQTYSSLGGKISWEFNLLEDRLTEGNETITATITNITTGQTVGNFQLTILDSSKTPTCNAFYSLSSSSNNVITNANEGTSVFLRVVPINGVNGDQWRVSIDGSSQANASDINNFTTMTIDDNGQSRDNFNFPITITNDELTEGNETLVMAIDLKRSGSGNWERITTANLVINDTSRTPAFEVYFATDSLGNNRVSQINEGQTVYGIVKTANVNSGTVLQINFAGSSVDSNDFTSNFPNDLNTMIDVTVNSSGIASYRFDVKEDFVDG